VTIAIVSLAALGCGGDVAAQVADDRVVAEPAPATGLALVAGVSVDARLLVITADGASASFAAISSALDYLGTPYDVFNAGAGPDLTTDRLADADHGRYYGIVLDTGDLTLGSTSALSDAEWMTLASYEARFGARRAVMYARPSESYGLVLTRGFDAKAEPIAARCTTEGSSVFVGAKCDGPVAIEEGWAYGSQPSDAATVPLLVDAAGSVYAATRRTPDGREVLVLTFGQSPTAFHTLALAYGVVSWVARGLFVGERHVYASPQIDDFFLPDAIYTGGTYRITDPDLQAFARWQAGRRAVSLTSQFRVAFAFNGDGAKPPAEDALANEALELASSFDWINHTWAHHVLTSMTYAEATDAIVLNNQYALGVGLLPYSIENLVTPEISGLDNAEAMRAVFDAGVRQLVSDTSVAGQDNPSPNAGYWVKNVPGLLAIPRRPSGLSYNVSLPAEWMARYGDTHGGVFSYEQILAACSDTLARDLLRGDYDPWMFHQPNVRDIGGGRSLLSDLMDATLDKYAARATFPVVSPTMNELARKVKERMALDASGVSATIEPGARLTVRVTNAATIPITGLCTPSAESYGGRQISHLELAAGQSVTLSLTECSAGGGGAGGGQGDRATGHLTTDAPPAPPGSGGSGCSVSGGRTGGGAGTLVLVVLAVAAVAARRRSFRR
jgi:MYXO-CTERM domain-containing protein